MVWKDNLIVEDTPITFEGFLDVEFGLNKVWGSFEKMPNPYWILQ